MKISPAALIDHARTEEGRKQLRYVGVSVVFVPVGQILIQLLGILFDGDFVKASLTSAAILTLPNFFANKLYVWKVTNRDNLRTQVTVFWVAAMLGVAMATGLTYLVQHSMEKGLVKSLTVVVAQLVGFGIVWVLRYLLLDKWLFKATHHGQEPAAEELDELHREFPI